MQWQHQLSWFGLSKNWLYFNNFPVSIFPVIFVKIQRFLYIKKKKKNSEVYSEPCETSKMELFAKIVKGFHSLTILTKRSILDTWQSSECAFVIYRLKIYAFLSWTTSSAQKVKFSIKNFFGKCDQICRFLRIWSHLLKKSLIENFIFCTVLSKSKRWLLTKFSWKSYYQPVFMHN